MSKATVSELLMLYKESSGLFNSENYPLESLKLNDLFKIIELKF